MAKKVIFGVWGSKMAKMAKMAVWAKMASKLLVLDGAPALEGPIWSYLDTPDMAPGSWGPDPGSIRGASASTRDLASGALRGLLGTPRSGVPNGP
jgi:hypothetical protein